MSRSTPTGIRLIKKFNWKSKWYIDHSKKNSYIKSLYDDYTINNIINNFYHFYTSNNLILYKNENNRFLKLYYSNMHINRSKNAIKIYYFYSINTDLKKRRIQYPFHANLEYNIKILRYTTWFLKSKYLIFLKFKNNIQLLTNEFIQLIYIRKRFRQNNLDFMWNLLELFYINQYRLGRVFGLFLNKFWFYNKKRRHKGFKLKIKGKMRGKSRTRTLYKRYGAFKTSTFNSEIQYIFRPISNIHGSYGIKIWLLITRNRSHMKLNKKSN
jgi:hypothetical protein